MGVSHERIVELHPRLYHMAAAGSWPSIQRHGLLSTSALLDLFEVTGDQRVRLEARHRPEIVKLSHPAHGMAELRDQKPMSDSGLVRALRDGLTPEDWYRTLNRRTFFWTTQQRLQRLLGGREYREVPQTVLVVDTKQLLERHGARVELSPYNSGSTKPNPFPRGRDCFLPPEQFAFEEWTQKRSRKAVIVELTVVHSVPDLAEMVVEVYETGSGQ